jgi:carbon-monoxide dehydrogenase large subunit
MGRFGIGQPVRRLEDSRLLTGLGQFVDDIQLPNQLHGYVLRSPHAHARLLRIVKTAAESMPGVHLVTTGAEVAAAGLGDIPCLGGLQHRNGAGLVAPPRPALPVDRVRHAGDAVAFVVADSLAAAQDAAEAVEVDYEPLPALVEPGTALDPAAPRIWDHVPNNLCLDWEAGDAPGVAAAFARATRRTRLTLVNNRVIVNPLEPRGAIGVYDRALDRFTLYSSTQGANVVRDVLADAIFRIARHRIRVVTPDVGGGFGMKMPTYPEQILVLWAARQLGRPVRWMSSRQEGFLTDTQARDQIAEAELALDDANRMLALRVKTFANMGAYLSSYGPHVPTLHSMATLPGPYRIPAVHMAVKCVFTNTAPVDAYRGAGRPESTYLLERLVDAAAREIGIAPEELRRRNFIGAGAMPFTTAVGVTYDSGDFERVMTAALREADWRGLPARREVASSRGRRRGIGLAFYVEKAGGMFENQAELRLETDGSASLLIGTQSSGQGHATSYAQIVSDGLGIDPEKVRLVQGDTDQIPFGTGTAAAASIPVGGHSVRLATEKMVATCRQWAASLLEAADADIEVENGIFKVVGTDRGVTLREIAAAAYDPKRAATGSGFGLSERALYRPVAATYPNGCHIAEVEVDPETGVVTVCRYTVVDDFGRVLNPPLLEGQVQGGTAQGIGQALFERCHYDPQTGQLLSGSFMDYQLPRAADLPMVRFATENIPCATNPMGIKGAGEAGALGAPPAVINAVLDALADLGVRDIDMPATPERVWRAIQQATIPR